MSTKPHIQVILGSTREGRFGEKPAAWVMDRLQGRDDLTVELLDLRDYPMPFYEGSRAPAHGHREYSPEVARWAEAVDRGDGYLVITPEDPRTAGCQGEDEDTAAPGWLCVYQQTHTNEDSLTSLTITEASRLGAFLKANRSNPAEPAEMQGLWAYTAP